MKSKLGYNQAIIAVAHKLARIVYHMVKMKVEYDESIDRLKNVNMLEIKRKLLQKRLAKIELLNGTMLEVSRDYKTDVKEEMERN